MGKIIDFNAFKENKNRKKLDKQKGIYPTQEDLFYDYINTMKVIVGIKPIKMGVLYVECLSEDEVRMSDHFDNEINYKEQFKEYYSQNDEKENLILTSLVYLCPSNIILLNSANFNKHMLFAVTQIFHGRIEIKS